MTPNWKWCQTLKGFEEGALELVRAAADIAIDQGQPFRIVLAGGNTPIGLYTRLRNLETNWQNWHVYFTDERCLPVHDPARNDRMATVALLGHVPIPESQIYSIPAERGPWVGAELYNSLLRDTPPYDLVLLGVGSDGHTASLFPGHSWGVEYDAPDALPVIGAPKAPSRRVTLSGRRLGLADHVVFLVSGPNKQSVVEQWLAGALLPVASIPASRPPDVLVTPESV